MPTISYTYDVVTPESAEQGDTADHGFCEPGGWEYSLLDPATEADVDAHPECYWVPVSKRSVREGIAAACDWGCVEDNGDGSFYSVDPDVDYSTGESRSHAVHFNGFTPATLGRISRAILGG